MPKRDLIIDRIEKICGPEENLAVAIWSEADVMDRGRERGIPISREKAKEVVDQIDRKHDACVGINWDVIDCYLDEVGQ